MKIRFLSNDSCACIHIYLFGFVGPCFATLNILLFLQPLFHSPKFGRNVFYRKTFSKYNRSIDILRRTLLWIFGKCKGNFKMF